MLKKNDSTRLNRGHAFHPMPIQSNGDDRLLTSKVNSMSV